MTRLLFVPSSQLPWLAYSYGGGIRMQDILVNNLPEAEPRHVPAPVAVRVVADPGLRVGQDVAAERVVPREPPELGEELVAGDVGGPRLGHGDLERRGVVFVLARRGYPLDADELRQGVDPAGLQGLDYAADGTLRSASSQLSVVGCGLWCFPISSNDVAECTLQRGCAFGVGGGVLYVPGLPYLCAHDSHGTHHWSARRTW